MQRIRAEQLLTEAGTQFSQQELILLASGFSQVIRLATPLRNRFERFPVLLRFMDHLAEARC
jgi:hypothetical protein